MFCIHVRSYSGPRRQDQLRRVPNDDQPLPSKSSTASSSTSSSTSSPSSWWWSGPRRKDQLRRVPNDDQPAQTSGTSQTHYGRSHWTQTAATGCQNDDHDDNNNAHYKCGGWSVKWWWLEWHHMMTNPLSRTPRPPSLWQQCWRQPPHSSRPTTAPTTRTLPTTARKTCTQTTTVPTTLTSTMVVPIDLLPPRTQTNGAPRDKSPQHRLSENPLESCPEYKYTLFLQMFEFSSSKYQKVLTRNFHSLTKVNFAQQAK